MMGKEQVVNEQNVSLERYLAELGWCGVPLPEVMVEISLAYLGAGLDASPVSRRLDGMIGDDTPCMEDCRHVLSAMLDEADRAGRIRLLARPGSRDAADALMALDHLCGVDQKDEPD